MKSTVDTTAAEPLKPHQMINRAWGKMPYAGGMGIRAIDEGDDLRTVAEKTAANLEALAGTLARVAEEGRNLEKKHATMRAAVRGFGALLDMAADLQGKRYRLTMRSRTTGGTDSETIHIHPGQDVNEEAARIAHGYGAIVESVEPI